MNRIYLIFLIIVVCSSVLSGQQSSARYNSTNNNMWLMYFGNHKVSQKLGIHAEVQVRRNEGLRNWQQLLLRTGLDYHTPNVRYTLGYAFIETYEYGEFPVANAFPEHRIWQQALVKNTLGKWNLSHRYRLEQRFLGNSATGEFANGRYENRIRYLARVNIPLKGSSIEPKSFYLGFYDEIFVNFGKEVGYNIFDQNRAYAAVGYHLGKIGKLEIGYLYQLLQQRRLLTNSLTPQNVMENNHTIQVALISDLPFYKEVKAK